MGVGGTDTARGMSFQHAQAVAACLDVLESDNAHLLRVEGAEDVIDYEICDVRGQRLRVCQAKTRKDPYQWAPGPILSIIARWNALDQAADAQLRFVTDGSLGPEVADDLEPALANARKDGLTDDDREYLKGKKLAVPDTLLKRVAIESRQPAADVTLDRVSLRLLRLLEMGMQPATVERAEALVDALFREISVRAGLDDIDRRVITREELAQLIGVGLDVIDRARRFDGAARTAYVAALCGSPPDASLVSLDAEAVELHPDALMLVSRTEAENPALATAGPATALLDEDAGAILSGPAGAGKSTTLRLLVAAAIERDLLPVLVSVEGYQADALERLVREVVERTLAARLSPGSIATLLADPGATLLLDGAGELEAGARRALEVDVSALQRSHSELRIIVASRDARRDCAPSTCRRSS